MKEPGPVDYSALRGPELQAWLVASAFRESGRTLALENVVQWLVFRLLQVSDRPADVKAELERHLRAQIAMTSQYAGQHRGLGDLHTVAEAASAIQALDEMLESLNASVAIDPENA